MTDCSKYAIAVALVLGRIFSQTIEEWRLKAQAIYDSSDVLTGEGIVLYDYFNPVLKGDSIRYCGDYVCDGWVWDYYSTGQLLHKGLYIMGQLETYYNYYPDGQKEREFIALPDGSYHLVAYHRNGKMRLRIKFNRKKRMVEYTTYYERGNVQVSDVYDKDGEVLIERKEYYPNGIPYIVINRVNARKGIYVQREFFPQGALKAAGKLVMEKKTKKLVKHEKWEYFNEDGVLLREEKYKNGQMVSSRDFQ